MIISNKKKFLPALFALRNLGPTPRKNYWSQEDCEFDSETDFPGLCQVDKCTHYA